MARTVTAYRHSMNSTFGHGAITPRARSSTGTTTYPARPNRLPGDACLSCAFPCLGRRTTLQMHHESAGGVHRSKTGKVSRAQREAGVSQICSQRIQQERSMQKSLVNFTKADLRLTPIIRKPMRVAPESGPETNRSDSRADQCPRRANSVQLPAG